MYWPIVPVPGDCEGGEVGGMKCGWQGKPKYSENTCPGAILSTTNPTCQTRAAAVGSQRLTASAMARPLIQPYDRPVPQTVTKHGPWQLKLTNSMQLSPSWEDTSRSATQQSPKIFLYQKVHYCVHKNPPLVSILSQANPVHITTSYLSKIQFNIILPPIRLGLPTGLFPSDFPTKILACTSIPLLPHSCYNPWPSHRPWLVVDRSGKSLLSFSVPSPAGLMTVE
jgi:hypothetical protein